ncbi:MAG: hypothetical protein DHS20C16_10210 [Phycisphaerae bacterium]|nr:MAG: hypothetical protein DHS20C16_10210 [Phycisphaerae bacterium]
MHPHGIMFHHFHGGDHAPSQGSIDGKSLADLIRHVGVERILSADEWLRRTEADALEKQDVCLTLDDALRCQIDVALPVLSDFGLTAFWFVHTSMLEGEFSRLEVYRQFRETCFDSLIQFYGAFEEQARNTVGCQTVSNALDQLDIGTYLAEYPFYTPADRRFRFIRNQILGEDRYTKIMDEMIVMFGQSVESLAENLWVNADDIRQLSESGHVIGLHSHTHPVAIAELPPDRQKWEYKTNAHKLRDIIGDMPKVMAHPCNSYTAETLEILRELGVTQGFRANMVEGNWSPLECPREDHSNIIREMQGCESPSSPATKLVTSH